MSTGSNGAIIPDIKLSADQILYELYAVPA